MAYLKSTGLINKVEHPTGHVVQTLSNHDKTEFSFTMQNVGNAYTSNGYGQAGTDYTGIDVTITPYSTTNKLFVFGKVSIGYGRGDVYGVMRMRKGGDGSFATMTEANCPWHKETSGTPGSGTLVGISLAQNIDNVASQTGVDIPFGFLDSPASIAAITYRINFLIQRDTPSPHGNAEVNGNSYNGTDYGNVAGSSFMTVMEIQAY